MKMKELLKHCPYIRQNLAGGGMEFGGGGGGYGGGWGDEGMSWGR